jgi:hypothetical protein
MAISTARFSFGSIACAIVVAAVLLPAGGRERPAPLPEGRLLGPKLHAAPVRAEVVHEVRHLPLYQAAAAADVGRVGRGSRVPHFSRGRRRGPRCCKQRGRMRAYAVSG